MKTESQRKQILAHLQRGQTITQLEALRLYGCMRLSPRCGELKRQGENIGVRTIHTLTGKHVSEYFLIPQS
jgi:hypothetical protein